MIDTDYPVPLPPPVGARVRWHASSGTNFGRVLEVDEEARTLLVQVENSTIVRTVEVDKAALVSAPGGAR